MGDCDRLIEVKITLIKGKHIRDFDNWPLNTGGPLNTVPYNTGLTLFDNLIFFHFQFLPLKT